MSGLPARVGSGGTRRDREMWQLRDRVLQLEEELLISKTQLEVITKQHNNLVQLMKMALAGDDSAAHEVAKFIGALGHEDKEESPDRATCDTPEQANGTAGYLNERQAFLTQQILQDENRLKSSPGLLKARSNSLTRLQRAASGDEHASPVPATPQVSRVGSAHPRGRLSYRSNLARTLGRRLSTESSPALLSSDKNGEGLDVRSLRYDDAMRYAQFGLFDPETVINMESKPPRNSHAKPHSAGFVRGERSLKYEVVRPATVTPSTRSAAHPDAPRYTRKQQQDVRQLATEADSCSPYPTSYVVNSVSHDQMSRVTVSPENSDDERAGRTAWGDPVLAAATANDAKRCDLAAAAATFQNDRKHELRHTRTYDEEQRRLKAMEDGFRRRAIRLQQQLGIAPQGMLFSS